MSIYTEKQVVSFMIALYCRKKHRKGTLCPECMELRNYAFDRLNKCPFGDRKESCKKCTVHCYRKEMREKIRKVMAFSGPRMILHPVTYLRYLSKK